MPTTGLNAGVTLGTAVAVGMSADDAYGNAIGADGDKVADGMRVGMAVGSAVGIGGRGGSRPPLPDSWFDGREARGVKVVYLEPLCLLAQQ